MHFLAIASTETESVAKFFAAREDAETFLAECLVDEPDWRDVMSVREFEFEASPN